MLHRAPVQELKTGRISRRLGYVAVVMQYYPRFIPKEKVDEYVRLLAPERGLFTEFKALDRQLGDHDRAFTEVRYQERFFVGAEGAAHLRRLAELSASKEVFLICQCEATQCCHADLLLLLARHWFSCRTQTPRREYTVFQRRIDDGNLPLPS